MFSRIIVHVDPRAPGGDALYLAHELAARDAHLIAVALATDTSAIPAARAALDLQLRRLPCSDSHVLVAADSTEVLVDFTRGQDADLLVMAGDHGDPFPSGPHLRQVVREVPCAVAIAPPGHAEEDWPLRDIGVGYDGSLAAASALAAAQRLAVAAGADAYVVEVVEGRPSLPLIVASGSMAAADEHRHTQAQADLDALPVPTGRVLDGDAVEALQRFAAGVDLLVVGREHHSGLGRLVHPGVAEALLGSCPAPLLLVPPEPVRAAAPAPGHRPGAVARHPARPATASGGTR